MDEAQILELLINVINGGCNEHQGDATEPAEFADMVFADCAEDQGDYISKQRLRETKQQAEQRIRLTNPITAAAISPALAYVEELRRTDGVHRDGNFKDSEKYAKVKESLSKYYGGQSIQDFLFESIKIANEQDPNSWLIFERVGNSNNTGYIFYPVFVESEYAVDWCYNQFGELDYFIFSEDEYQVKQIQGGNEVIAANNYYLYAAGVSAYAQNIANETPLKFPDELYFTVPGNEDYVIWVFLNNGTIETPVIRLGAYQSDIDINEPCELIYEAARGYLKDLMGLKSSHDLNRVLHMYPKLIEYVKSCEAIEQETGLSCMGGYYNGDPSRRCGACNGTGKIVHTSEQDVVTFRFPESKDAFVDLSQVAHYVTLPMEILTNQQEELQRLSTVLTFVIYSQEQTGRVQPGVTATEIAINYTRIYNKLLPIAMKWAQAEEKAYRIAMQYYGAFSNGDSYHVQFPMDFAMKTEVELISDLAASRQAGAPFAIQKAISDALLRKKYKDNPSFVSDQIAFDSLKPFSDKSPEELAMILSTRPKNDPRLVAWQNWQEIQHNIQSEIKARGDGSAFYLYPIATQKQLIKEKVDSLISEIPADTNQLNALNQVISG